MHDMRKTIGRQRDRQRRCGAVLVEFAVCAPIIFAVIFASFEFCRVNMIRHTMDNAAYEGARKAIVPGATAQTARAAADSLLAILSVRDSTVTISPATIAPQTPEVTVTIDVPLQRNSWSAPLFFNRKSLTTSCTLSREVNN